MIYDLIIIGMGPGGMSAAIYAKRSGLNVLILEKSIPGGLINMTAEVENYLGFSNITGPELTKSFLEHIKSLDIPYKTCEVLNIELDNANKKVKTRDEEFLCKSIIIATGRTPRLLGLPNEKELTGKGISRCALCDGMFFKDKSVAVIGGGMSAMEEGLYLAEMCSKVYIIYRKDSLRGENSVKEKVINKDNIEVIYNTNVTKINKENGLLKSIVLNEEKELDVSGMFVYIGYDPITKFTNNLVQTNEQGYILVNDKYETSCKNIYAIGDTIKKDYYQIVTAVSDGAVAAINVSKNLNSRN